MIGTLVDRWMYTWTDIWEPLGNVENAPFELYAELYRTAANRIRPKPSFDQLSTVVGNYEMAYEAFRGIESTNFKDESEVITFFEDTYDTLAEFGILELALSYVQLVRAFLRRYNLRYQVVQPFSLRLQMPWLYADIYSELVRLNQADAHLAELMEDFEAAFDTFSRTTTTRDMRISIAKASNYVEGIAAFTLGTSGGTLGQLCDRLTTWPHSKVKDSIKNLYGFCSDYPNIRHAGNPNNKLSDLDAKDTIVISMLMIAFSSYMHHQLNIDDILDG